MVSHKLCWKFECWLYIFTTTRANRVCKSFSLSLSIYQLNCLRTSKGLSLGSWYVSVVSTFPNTFALVLDSNLHDLNGTNPDWRCFQQNCHGVIFVQKQKFSEWPETSRRIFLELIKNTGERIKARGPTPCPRGWGRAPLPCGPPRAPPTYFFLLYIYPYTPKTSRSTDTSPSYLLFQTLLPLFGTLTCMIWMELTRTDAVFSRIAMVLFLGRNKSSQIELKIYRELLQNI